MLGRLVNEMLREKSPSYPWGDTLPIFLNADFRICNLECVISNRGTPQIGKEFHFRSDSKNTAVLQIAKINAVSLANNHVLDYGHEALFDTLDLLNSIGIYHAGAGRNDQEAIRPAVANVKGSKVGLIAFTDNEPGWEAKQNMPGVFYSPVDLRDVRAERLLSMVRETRRDVDTLIVSAHWGPNWGYQLPKEQIEFAHSLIDAGVDLLFGHSGHIFRGIEIYKRQPIIYCAGDFIDDYAVDLVERNDESFIFEVEAREREISHIRLYPAQIKECQAQLARGKARSTIAGKMEYLCAKMQTKSEWKETNGCLEIKVD
jgi:poly-gamma-glutamate capsule biosynthesis protein CapA/YwtB (metallophosphatase superfamily)